MNPALLTSGRFRGEVYRIATTGFLLFLLIAANTFIKILRDSIFLGHHPVTELPYLYILVALLAGIVLGVYSKYTARLSIVRLILATNVIIILSMILFWLLLNYSNAGWVHYAFYIWSAIIGVIAVAQIWILANQVFTSEEAKQSFGILAAGGTLGGVAAAFCVRWSVHASIESNHLLWCVAGLYVIGSVIVIFAERRFNELMLERRRLDCGNDGNGSRWRHTGDNNRLETDQNDCRRHPRVGHCLDHDRLSVQGVGQGGVCLNSRPRRIL